MRLRKRRPERVGAVEIPDRVHRFGGELLLRLGDRSRVLLHRGPLPCRVHTNLVALADDPTPWYYCGVGGTQITGALFGVGSVEHCS